MCWLATVAMGCWYHGAAEPNWRSIEPLIHFLCVDGDVGVLKRVYPVSRTSRIGGPRGTEDDPRLIAAHMRGADSAGRYGRVTSWLGPTAALGNAYSRQDVRLDLHLDVLQAGVGNVRSQLVGIVKAVQKVTTSERKDGIRFFLFGSVAGATGSGLLLPVGYLCHKVAREMGLSRPESVATVFMPSVFRDLVGPMLRTKIEANGMAALKEIERCMELEYAGQPRMPTKIEFVYDAAACGFGANVDPAHDFVDKAPFHGVYVVERSAGKTAQEIFQGASEMAYFEVVGGSWRPPASFGWWARLSYGQPRLALLGRFSDSYSSFGVSSIAFPRQRFTAYCARRHTIEVLQRVLVGSVAGETDSLGRDFDYCAKADQSRRLDMAFVEMIDESALSEVTQAEDNGICDYDQHRAGEFCRIKAMMSSGKNVMDEVHARLREILEVKLEYEIDVRVETGDINLAKKQIRNCWQ